MTQKQSTFVKTRGQPRIMLSWKTAIILSLGSMLLVTVSLGSMAGEIGMRTIFVWGVTAFVGVLICLLLAEMAGHFPHKLGGAPAYVHEGFKPISPWFGVFASWSYWIAWIPGVAVNLMLAATYLQATFFPGINRLLLTGVLIVLLYSLTYFGLKINIVVSAAVAICAFVPLCMIVCAPVFHPSLWHPANFTTPVTQATSTHPWYTVASLGQDTKWMFVAAWSSYGGEMVATMIGEFRHPQREGTRAILVTAALGFLAFTLIPIALIALVGYQAMTQDPSIVFLTAAKNIFGPSGTVIISLMLIASLILGAEIFILSSSRALYQMSQDGLIFKGYRKVNAYGVPVGSMFWDCLVTFSLLAIFGGNIVNVVAAANVGYLLVFILLPGAYLLVRHRSTERGHGQFRLPALFTAIAFGVLLFNLLLLFIGGMQWGCMVVGIGILLVLTCIPLHVLSKCEHTMFWKKGQTRRRAGLS